MKRFSQAQKRIMSSLRRCFVLHPSGQMTLFKKRISRADRVTSAATMVKCGLCRFDQIPPARRAAFMAALEMGVEREAAMVQVLGLSSSQRANFWKSGRALE